MESREASCRFATFFMSSLPSAPASYDAMPGGCAYTGGGLDVTSDGLHILYAAASDNAGNKGVPASLAFKIDKTPPAVAITRLDTAADGFFPADAALSFPANTGSPYVSALRGTVSDSVSGVSSTIYYRTCSSCSNTPAQTNLLSGTWASYPFTLISGVNKLYAFAYDLAGNHNVIPVSVDVTFVQDIDNDGIYNNVDGDSTVSPAVPQWNVASLRFSDKLRGGKTSGRFAALSAGGARISDSLASAPNDGLLFVINDGCYRDASGVLRGLTASLDGKSGTYTFCPGWYTWTDPASEVTAQTVQGGPAELDYILNGQLVQILVPAGSTATVSETKSATGELTGISVLPTSSNVTLNGQPLPTGQTIATGTLTGKLSVSNASLNYDGTFTAGVATNGLSPSTEQVVLAIGSYTFNLAAGSFTRASDGSYSFNGTTGGVKLSMQLTPQKGGKWAVKVNGKPVSGLTSSSPVKLRVGDDASL